MKRITTFNVLAIGVLLLVVAAYSNHFHNPFDFDDEHTIVNNAFIRELRNIPQFFKSATTFSSLPMNQTYRPMLTALYAIDYHFGGMNSFYFHVPIFIFFLLQGLLMYLVIVKVFNNSFSSPANPYFALFAVAWYMVSTANADVINYVSASSDSISTFWVVAAMALYIYYPQFRKWMLYLLPVIIGTLFKQPALVFPGLFAMYVFLFESTNEKKEVSFFERIKKTLLIILPSLILCAVLYELQAKLTSSTYVTGGSFYNYVITQPFVALHYFFTFFMPIGLTADSDWVALQSISDYRFWIGIVFLGLLVFILFRLLANKKMAPVVFGLAWFIIALLPSALVPLSEVMNDYRAFFPYVGLVMAIVWMIYLGWEKWIAGSEYPRVAIVLMMLILAGNAYGTYSRNKVWHNSESLWYDVTIKSPDNSRGMMNYGLALMGRGDYSDAEKYFLKTAEMIPYYPYVYVNLGVLNAQLKRNDEAEAYFKKGLQYGATIPATYYFYARYLHNNGKNDDAINLLKQAISLSPADLDSRHLAMEIYKSEEDWQSLNMLAKETLALVPGDNVSQGYLSSAAGRKGKVEEAEDKVRQNPNADNYINLSLIYYGEKEYDKCIDACNEALKLDAKNSIAYNNIGSACNALGDWESAIEAFKKAISIQPDFQLAKNNYRYAAGQLTATDSIKLVIKKTPTPENYINLSLLYYREGLFLKMADACNELIKINPSYELAYNNLCVAYNSLQRWDDAITAGEKAVQLAPKDQLAKNNLAVSTQGKANLGK